MGPADPYLSRIRFENRAQPCIRELGNCQKERWYDGRRGKPPASKHHRTDTKGFICPKDGLGASYIIQTVVLWLAEIGTRCANRHASNQSGLLTTIHHQVVHSNLMNPSSKILHQSYFGCPYDSDSFSFPSCHDLSDMPPSSYGFSNPGRHGNTPPTCEP